MTMYRTGNHWGVTIVREGDGHCPISTDGACISMTEGFARCENGECMHHESGGTRDELVAVVVNGDQALAERICALLNGEGVYAAAFAEIVQRLDEYRGAKALREGVRAAIEGIVARAGHPYCGRCNERGEACAAHVGEATQVRAFPAPPGAPEPSVGGNGHPGPYGGNEGPPEVVIPEAQGGAQPVGAPVCEHGYQLSARSVEIGIPVHMATGKLCGAPEQTIIATSEAAQHRPERRGSDSEGYGACTGCGDLWPCAGYRGTA